MGPMGPLWALWPSLQVRAADRAYLTKGLNLLYFGL